MNTTKSWYVANWAPLAWLETALKLVALVVGMTTAVSVIRNGELAFPSGLELVQFIILVVLSLGLLAAIYDRVQDREIVAMVFVILNNLGHWGMVLALTAVSLTRSSNAIWLFASFMLLGDLVKLWFIKTEDFTVRDYPQRVLYGLTLVYVVGYVLILVLAAI